MQKELFAVRFEKETLQKIDQIAEKNCRTRSNMIRFIVQKYLESHEV